MTRRPNLPPSRQDTLAIVLTGIAVAAVEFTLWWTNPDRD